MSAPVSNPNSNTFRAEPFVNLTAESVSNGTGAMSGGSSSRRPSQVFSAADPGEREMIMQEEHDELLDNDDEGDTTTRMGTLPTTTTSTRLPHNDGGRLSISSVHHAASSISDLQRASIASTSSSTSSARRSSYDPNEPGVLEKIHTGQGKSKRKPISVQQWKHMTTFKIRPPTATEAASSSSATPSIPTPISVDPFSQYSPPLSGTPDRKTESETGFVFIPEGNSANAVPPAPPVPRAVPIVMPPASITNTSASATPSKPTRKRARREEPNDPNIQIFYHDEVAPTFKRRESLDIPPTPPHHSVDPLSPDMNMPPTTIHPISPPLAVPPTSIPQPQFTAPIQPPAYPIKYDATEQVFILPEMEPLERGSVPSKKWAPVHREMRTLGGGSWHAATWISQGDSAVPTPPPAGFIPGPISSSHTPLNTSNLQGLNALSALALGAASGLVGSATPTLGASSLAPAKRIKKVKSDASIGVGVTTAPSAVTSGGGVGRKKPSVPSVKKGKKVVGRTFTPIIMEPPLVAITRAVSDTEMPDA